jgi:hypothetical protein
LGGWTVGDQLLFTITTVTACRNEVDADFPGIFDNLAEEALKSG